MSPRASTELLTRYLAAISAPGDESSTAATAVRSAAATFDADVAAVVVDGAVRGYHGPDLVAAPIGLVGAAPGTGRLTVDGLGELYTAVAPLDDATGGATGGAGGAGAGGAPGGGGTLVVARAGQPFDADDTALLGGMAHALGLALRGLRTIAVGRTMLAEHERESGERLRLLNALGTRQRLLETVLSIQRSIANHKPLQEILDSVTSGAASMLDRAAVTLVLPDQQAGSLHTASAFGLDDLPGDPLVFAAAAEAMEANCVVARTDEGTRRGYRSVVAAPVVVSGVVAGSLAAETTDGHGHAVEHRELLTAFAQQVGLALTDARTTAAIHAAHHDQVTGLPNRTLFLERVTGALTAGDHRAAEITILLIDLHRFKTVNDGLGHRAGDTVLAAVADRIRGCLRTGDLIARVGGDEFGVLLDGAGSIAGARVARSIIDAIEEPFRTAGRTMYLTACVGVAASTTTSSDAGDLLTNADVAMNRAKQAGPRHIEIFEPHMHTEIIDRLDLLDDLQLALARAELRLQYQPLVDLATGTPVGVEALARWRHPRRGDVAPSTFIPLAEETGLILELGLWILREGCRQVSEWRGLVPGMRLNINVSARQAMDPDFVTRVAKAQADSDLPGGMLTLELTETMLMGDPDLAMAQLRQLKNLGVRLSIDDFGTGYSSLSYLRQFPVDQLKIDRAFVDGAATGGDQLAVTRTVMDLGRTLRLETVAEGIEDDEQLSALRGIGCDLGQGFLLARPMEPDAVREYFKRLC
jgi:diguanylate cyclase (GGDEF)-like protein